MKKTFLKRLKPKRRFEIRQVNQTVMNKTFMAIFASIVLLATLSILASLTRSTKPASSTSNTATVTTSDVDNRLSHYLTDFVYAYFYWPEDTAKQADHVTWLNRFYINPPEIHSQGLTKAPMALKGQRLVAIKDKQATFSITYTTNGKDFTTGFVVPFEEKEGTYYVSGLPWFTGLPTSQAKDVKARDALPQDTTTPENDKKEYQEFLTLFFTNYTTNQDNLDLLADDQLVLQNTIFKSIDYSYFKVKGKTITAYCQVTFESQGTTHEENFTLTIKKKDKGYFVTKVEHTIPTNID